MKINFAGWCVLILVLSVSACKKGETFSDKGFNGISWGTDKSSVEKKEAPKEGMSFEINQTTELGYEGSYLGVNTNIETEDEARITYVFADNKLIGGYYNIFGDVKVFNPKVYVDQIVESLGSPTKEWSEELNSENKIWLTSRAAVRIMAKDFGDKFAFEWYVYEISWFNQHRDQLGWPE